MGICKSTIRFCFPDKDVFTDTNELANRSHVVDRNSKSKEDSFSVDSRVRQEFKAMDADKSDSLDFKEIKALMLKLNYQIPTSKLRKTFDAFDLDHSGALDFREFKRLFNTVVSVPQGIEQVFVELVLKWQMEHDNEDRSNDFGGDDLLQQMLPVPVLKNFLVNTQGDRTTDLSQLLSKRELQHGVSYRRLQQLLTHSGENLIFNPGHGSVYQDMTRPLSHYHICASHNTYLEADQLLGDSSAEAVARALEAGCKVIELDVWDGPFAHITERVPICLHGHTKTKPVLFKDCLVAIRRKAFTHSKYPCILTIENHCCLDLQGIMADILVDVFGDMLHIPPANNDDKDESSAVDTTTTDGGCKSGRVAPRLHFPAQFFPSPEELAGKILLRDKMSKHNDEVDDTQLVAGKVDGDDDDDAERAGGAGVGAGGGGGAGGADGAAPMARGVGGAEEPSARVRGRGGRWRPAPVSAVGAADPPPAPNARKGRGRGRGRRNWAKVKAASRFVAASRGRGRGRGRANASPAEVMPATAREEMRGSGVHGSGASGGREDEQRRAGEEIASQIALPQVQDDADKDEGEGTTTAAAAGQEKKSSGGDGSWFFGSSGGGSKGSQAKGNSKDKEGGQKKEGWFFGSTAGDTGKTTGASSLVEGMGKMLGGVGAKVAAPLHVPREDKASKGRRSPRYARLITVKNAKVKEWDDVFGFSAEPTSCSISEKNLAKLTRKHPKCVVEYCRRHLCRTYPGNTRVDSSNYNPCLGWDLGAQIVALNFQTHTRPMWMMRGMFADNGGCGYVLKPNYMLVRQHTGTSADARTPSPSASARDRKVLPGGGVGAEKQEKESDVEAVSKGATGDKKGAKEWNQGKRAKVKRAVSARTSAFFKTSTAGTKTNKGQRKKGERDKKINGRKGGSRGSDDAGKIGNEIEKVLMLTVMSGHYLPKPGGSTKGEIIDPYVSVYVDGTGEDTAKATTPVVHNNGFNPEWSANFHFPLSKPEQALVTFKVMDYDAMTADDFIGQYSIAVRNIRPGFRMVPLLDKSGNRIRTAYLFVMVILQDPSKCPEEMLERTHKVKTGLVNDLVKDTGLKDVADKTEIMRQRLENA